MTSTHPPYLTANFTIARAHRSNQIWRSCPALSYVLPSLLIINNFDKIEDIEDKYMSYFYVQKKLNISLYSRDLSFGRGQTAPVRGAEMPAVVSGDAWDGLDGELPPEEDIDLSDVDLEKDEL